jgi:hypothetical protein
VGEVKQNQGFNGYIKGQFSHNLSGILKVSDPSLE